VAAVPSGLSLTPLRIIKKKNLQLQQMLPPSLSSHLILSSKDYRLILAYENTWLKTILKAFNYLAKLLTLLSFFGLLLLIPKFPFHKPFPPPPTLNPLCFSLPAFAVSHI
jgi:hypothetical protein